MLRTVYMYIMYTVYFFRNIYMHVHAYIAIKHRIYIISVKKNYHRILCFFALSESIMIFDSRGRAWIDFLMQGVIYFSVPIAQNKAANKMMDVFSMPEKP